MKKLLILAALAGAFFWYKGGIGISSAGAFSESGEPQIWLFTFNDCGSPCKQAIDDLEMRSANYKLLTLDDGKEVEDLWASMGKGALPFYAIGEFTHAGYFKSFIASGLGQAFGERYLTEQEKKYMQNHFYPDGRPKVYIYGASWCPYCKQLREQLEADDIDYLELDVEKASDRTELVDTMQISGYPIVYVGYKRIQGGVSVLVDGIKGSI